MSDADVVVLGAGIAGLVAARQLELGGRSVTVLDKGRGPGGRLATRHPRAHPDVAFDHGAQFVTLRAPELADEAARWRANGWLVEWFRGPPNAATADDGHPRYRGAPYQRALPEALAAELGDVRTATRVTEIGHDGASWRLRSDDGTTHRGRALLSTAPAPQALALLDAGAVALEPALRTELERVTYDPCIAVLAIPAGPVGLPSRGALRLDDDPALDIIVDNQTKGVSHAPSLTLHATAAWTRSWWDSPDELVGAALVDAARVSTGCGATVVQVHRWRYSTPTSTHRDLAPGAAVPGPVRFAGDAFAGGRVEGAALSGWTAAHRLLAELR